MKAIFVLLAAATLVSFSKKEENSLDGIWMGYYRAGSVKEKVIIKFDGDKGMECYTGGVDDKAKCTGSYELSGDTVSFTYTTLEGQEISMQGQLNYRKTYVDGIWKTGEEAVGKFYLERQKVEERFIQP